jgi:type I restriction enzyme R subunit
MLQRLNEQILTEQAVIDWFKELGYEYKFGPDISPGGILAERDFKDVILEGRLRSAIKRLNPHLNDRAVNDAIYKLKSLENPNLEILNHEVYRMITEGIKIEVRDEKGNIKGEIVKVIDFEDSLNNEFLVVNQLSIQGAEVVRRPDVVVFINGLPIAVFELKNPLREEATIHSAYYQLEEYKKDIPELFKYNQILVISDLTDAKYGTISSSYEWFKKWREPEKEEKLEGVSELEILVKGIFQKNRLLDIIENFIVFEADADENVSKYTKKICLYHQYFGVNKAIEKTLQALKPKGDGKIGVLWHTQGSGKTLSMVFYVNKAKKLPELNSPTFLFLTDRNDLDDQFYKTFKRCGYGPIAKQANSVKDLFERLKNAGAELIFSTVQKFTEEFDVVNEKNSIIVIADEAHRSHYRELATYYRKALPNASFMGITATPISTGDRDTRVVFGDYIDIYPISKSVEDNATVRIYYESRLVHLHLTNYFIDEEFNELIAENEIEIDPKLKEKFVNFENVIFGNKERLKEIAKDIVNHFNNRGVEGKAMVVTASRRVAVEMYKLISSLPDAPEVAVVISNPQEFKGEIQGLIDKRELERRFKNPDDPLKMVIVCDMWLTGFDVPCLHTMYFDKPLKNHGLMQAIARVNRIYKDKIGGLIVDYIGIADDLRKSLAIYDPQIRQESMINLQEVINKMLEKFDIVKSMLGDIDYSNWKYLEGEKLARLIETAINNVITDLKTGYIDEERKKTFLKESLLLIKLHAFVMPHKEAYEIKNDIEFISVLRSNIIKRTTTPYISSEVDSNVETVIKELVSKSVSVEGIIDIFELRGKEKPEISIFDGKFLEEVKNLQSKNLAIETLKKLLNDEIKSRERKNPIRYKSLREKLVEIIDEYENRLINASKVIEKLVELAKEIKKKVEEGESLGLSEEELAFYDIISQGKRKFMKDEEIKKIVNRLINEIRKDLSIDWTNKDIIKSRIKANIRRILLQNDITEKLEPLVNQLFDQTVSLFKDWSPNHSLPKTISRL